MSPQRARMINDMILAGLARNSQPIGKAAGPPVAAARATPHVTEE